MKAIHQGVRYTMAETEGDFVQLLDGPRVLLGDPGLVVDPTDDQWSGAVDPESLPVFNETDLKTLAPGMYLGLMHGRFKPEDELNDWGFNGPIIGPLLYCHVTYCATVNIKFTSIGVAKRHGCNDVEPGIDEPLKISADLMFYRGKYYGDWSVFIAPDCAL